MEAPSAPWALVGECVVAVVSSGRGPAGGSRPGSLPPGLRPVPGPGLLVALRHADSPVGPYMELVIARPARLGVRLGWCVTDAVVTSPEARLAGRRSWGLPTELGNLRWCGRDDEVEVVWAERDLVLWSRAMGPGMPLLSPGRWLQRRADGPVVVPLRARGRARMARIVVDVPASDPLVHLAGRHLGAHLCGLSLVMERARLPSGLRATLLAPLGAQEPALSSPAEASRGD